MQMFTSQFFQTLQNLTVQSSSQDAAEAYDNFYLNTFLAVIGFSSLAAVGLIACCACRPQHNENMLSETQPLTSVSVETATPASKEPLGDISIKRPIL